MFIIKPFWCSSCANNPLKSSTKALMTEWFLCLVCVVTYNFRVTTLLLGGTELGCGVRVCGRGRWIWIYWGGSVWVVAFYNAVVVFTTFVVSHTGHISPACPFA
jgi:hypothetical protein